jgi:DNA-binding response OmpR family regulator
MMIEPVLAELVMIEQGDAGVLALRPMATTILIVEDDELIASSLARALSSHGYEVEIAGTVADAMGHVTRDSVDLVLLDLGLPDGDGSEVCEAFVRQQPTVPIVVLTARREEIDVVLGLEAGAVDFVVKPFRLAELLARIATHLRYAAQIHAGRSDDECVRLVVGDLVVDRGSRRVMIGDTEVALRPREFDLLARLAQDAGRVVTREQLIDDVWDKNWWGSTKTVDVHVNALRRKLGEKAGGPSRIVTLRGVGYRLEPAPVEQR